MADLVRVLIVDDDFLFREASMADLVRVLIVDDDLLFREACDG